MRRVNDPSSVTIVPCRLLILNYHRLADATNDRYAVSPAAFEKQLQLVRELNVPVIAPGASENNFPFAVAFTFDDGHTSDIDIAQPLLQQFGFTAAFFPVIHFIGKENRASETQLRSLSEAKFIIGSHGSTHRDLRTLSQEEQFAELRDSKQQLEMITGKPVDLFALPYGRYNANVLQQAKLAGYRAVLSTDTTINTLDDEHFLLHRWNVRRGTSLRTLRALLSGNGTVPAKLVLTSKAKTMAKKLLNR